MNFKTEKKKKILSMTIHQKTTNMHRLLRKKTPWGYNDMVEVSFLSTESATHG
jgi:hypothetical protein